MSKYLGVKLVDAEPMVVTADLLYASMEGHLAGTEGYEVTYETGYKSWCPKVEFEANNTLVTELSFSQAIDAANAGNCIARRAWNTFYNHVRLGDQGAELPPTEAFEGGIIPPLVQEDADNNFYILHTEEREDLVNWGPTHTEMQATDWYIWTLEEADAAFQEHIGDGPE